MHCDVTQAVRIT